jgi:hypothetical protein
MRTGTIEVHDRAYNLDSPADVVRLVARERYAWPGGYMMFAVLDGAMLCSNCVRERYDIELRDALDGTIREAGIMHDGEFDGPEYCDHCGLAFGVFADKIMAPELDFSI